MEKLGLNQKLTGIKVEHRKNKHKMYKDRTTIKQIKTVSDHENII